MRGASQAGIAGAQRAQPSRPVEPLRAAGRLALALLACWGAAVDCLLPSPNFAIAHLMVARKRAR